jgi:ectoine hydroxylase-related dioxygenase (phytanoyl-CoA dioxygenase family)
LNPKILDVVENLIGPDIQLHHTKLNLKPPSSREARFEWHQDYPFFPHTNFDLLAVMVYFDDSTEENGCLTIVPGSHKMGPRNHLFAKDGAFSSQLEDKSVVGDPSSWLKVPVPAGGIELHHCNMLHSSTANRGTKPRSAMVIQYRAADNVALGGNMSNVGFGMQVRGVNPYRVRMIGGTFKLPGKIEDPLQRDG